MEIKTVDVKTAKGKFAKMNINRIYNSDEKFIGYKAIVIVGWNKKDWVTFHILKDKAGGYLLYGNDGQLLCHKNTLKATKRKCASVAIDNIDSIPIDESTISYNRFYGKAVNNSQSTGDIDINIKQRVERVFG